MRASIVALITSGVISMGLAGCGGGGDTSPVYDATPSTVKTNGGVAAAITPAGSLSGLTTDGVVSFRGVPFAQPPTGDLRWMPPVAATKWSGVRDATGFAKHCPQENDESDVNASEDCLYLNVYAPAAVADVAAKPRPVMVWVYGGANAYGAGDFYDPRSLVKAGDVVVVTLNYRVGALGFLAHPALRTAASPGTNYGVMDQQLALQWVKSNIDSLGGDASNVTLFGESAGGLNTMTHLISDGSKGLFHKAIIESGGYLLETPSLAEADTRGAAFATRLGCAQSEAAACLRRKTVADILAAQGTVNTDNAAYRQMVLDGQVLKESQATALQAGRFQRVPVMLGANSNEGRLFFSPAAMQATYDDTVAQYSTKNHRDPLWTKAVYPFTSFANAFEASAAVLGDAEFACPARRTSQWFSQFVPTYSYEFSDPASLVGSGHFAEIYYLFEFRGQTALGIRGSADSQALATSMQRYWANFARNSDPNATGLPSWSPYLPTNHAIQRLVPPTPGADVSLAAVDYVARHKCDFWGVH